MKNEELNLVELLKDCPKGTKLYSPLVGEVRFDRINKTFINPIDTIDEEGDRINFTQQGTFFLSAGECLLFPSKDQRDWNVWKAEQKKKHQYQVGDYITLSKNQLSAYFDKIIDSDFGVFKIIEKNETQFTAHYVDAETIQPICIGIDFLETIPFCKVDKFDPKWLKPFDKVLCRHLDKDKWKAHFFSHIDTDDREYPFYATFAYRYCIPYNLETKHLVGTTEKAPEFYINWEE
jgi:hypothetical protein